MGIPPMVQLAKTIQGEKQIIVGYRNSETFLDKDLDRRGDLYIATEDGSLGTKGNVMDAIRENKLTADMILPAAPCPCFVPLKVCGRSGHSRLYFLRGTHGMRNRCVLRLCGKDRKEGPAFPCEQHQNLYGRPRI